jgi:phosphoribosyl-AMP cyclohydrolase
MCYQQDCQDMLGAVKMYRYVILQAFQDAVNRRSSTLTKRAKDETIEWLMGDTVGDILTVAGVKKEVYDDALREVLTQRRVTLAAKKKILGEFFREKTDGKKDL